MLRAVLWTLRQRRYAALSVLMVLIAAGCVAMGTFELHRYQEKRSANSVLRDNAHAPAAPLTTSLVPLVGTSGGADVRYRTVVATGEYSGGDQYLVNESQDGSDGFYVLTPLRTSSGVLLVVRGFVAESATDPSRPARVVPVPTGPVQVRGWLQAGETAGDRHSGDLVFTVNPTEQAARLGVPVYRSFLVLTSGQPGVGTLGIVPPPGLSNPTGGAAEWQLLSYVVQWYVFALLALLAPFLFSRSEAKDARRRFLGIDPDAAELGLEAAPAPALTDGSGGELVVRQSAELARSVDAAVLAQRWEQASQLADRYGRSLGPEGPEEVAASVAPMRPGAPRYPVRDSTSAPHRSDDLYHGSYNDHLWRLAMADGELPDVVAPPRTTQPRPEIGDIAPQPIRPDRSSGGEGSDSDGS